MQLKHTRLAALAGIVAMAVAACGGGPSTTTSPGSGTAAATSAPAGATSAADAAPAGSAEGTLTIWADGKAAPAIQVAADNFAAANGVQVNLQTIASGTQSTFVTAAQAGNSPDLVIGAHDFIGNLVQNGTIDPIPMTDAAKAAFNPLSIKAVTFNGQVYGVPYSVENLALFRNTDLAPTAPATMDDLITTGKELVASGKATEILALPVGQNGDAYHSYPLFTGAGGTLFGKGPDGGFNPQDLQLDTPESIAAAAKLGQLGAEGVLKTSISTDNVSSIFTTGKSAYMISGPWQIPDIEKAGVKYDITPVPPFAGGPAARPFVGVQAMYVASKGKNKALAQEFATNYFNTPEVQVALYEANPRPPALIAAFDQVEATDPNMQKIVDAGRDGDILPSIPEMNIVWDPWGKAQAAIIGGADPASTMASTTAAIKAQIK